MSEYYLNVDLIIMGPKASRIADAGLLGCAESEAIVRELNTVLHRAKSAEALLRKKAEQAENAEHAEKLRQKEAAFGKLHMKSALLPPKRAFAPPPPASARLHILDPVEHEEAKPEIDFEPHIVSVATQILSGMLAGVWSTDATISDAELTERAFAMARGVVAQQHRGCTPDDDDMMPTPEATEPLPTGTQDPELLRMAREIERLELQHAADEALLTAVVEQRDLREAEVASNLGLLEHLRVILGRLNAQLGESTHPTDTTDHTINDGVKL